MQIELKNVNYSYIKVKNQDTRVIKNLSFKIADGDFVAIVGQTGAGKSTLTQMFNGLIIPNDGEIIVGKTIINNKTKVASLFNLRKQVGLVFQFPEYQLFEDTILKDVMFGPKNFGQNDEEAEKASRIALKSVGVEDLLFDKSPFEVSGGQKRRIAIAGILSSNPEVIVLDEPTVGLDPRGKEEIMSLLTRLNKEGKTIILITHDMDVVMKYARKVLVIKDGVLVKESTPFSLFNDKNIENYSLEIPEFYRFKNFLIKNGFKKNIDSINDLDKLVEAICEVKNHE